MATLTFKAGASWFAPNVTTIKRNIITAINIVDSYVVTGNEIDSWDASEDNDGSIMCYVTGTILTIAGNGSGTIKFNADQSYWLYTVDGKDYFKNCTSFTGLSLIDTSNCTTLNRAFRGLEKITSLDIGHFDISNVTSLYQTFCYCKKLTSLPIENWDVSNVTTMAYTFYQIGASTLPIENWNVSNLTNLDHTFAHSTSLNNLDLTKWDVSNVTNMNATFCGMKALTSLDLSTWDTSKVTCFPQFVEGCSNLETIYGLENFDTSQSVCFAQMFRGCSKLKELDLSSFDTRNADSGTPTSDNGSTSGCTWQMITNTHSLEKITLGKYFTFEGKGIDIVPAEDIGTLPTPSASYIEGADGNWYTEDFTAYAPADVPNLTEMTYYASKKVVNDVIDTRVLNFKGLKHVLASLNTVINESLDKIDLSGLETKEDAQVKYDELNSLASTQADWNITDESDAGFIQNKTHWVEKSNQNISVVWDGDTTDKIVVADMYYHVSDIIIENNDIIKSGTFTAVTPDGEMSVTGEQAWSEVITSDDVVVLSFALFVKKSNITFDGIEFKQAGIYFINDGDVYISKFECFSEIDVFHTLDEKYIPDNIARLSDVSSIPNDFYIINTTSFTMDKINGSYDPSTLTIAIDKTFDEITKAYNSGKIPIILNDIGDEYSGNSRLGDIKGTYELSHVTHGINDEGSRYIGTFVFIKRPLFGYEYRITVNINNIISVLAIDKNVQIESHNEDYHAHKYIQGKITELDDKKADKADYETKTDAQTKYDEAIAYADTAVANLVNSAPETLDTLGELATAFEENAEVVDALNEAIVNKADVGHVHSWDELEDKPFYDTLKSTVIFDEDVLFDEEANGLSACLFDNDNLFEAVTNNIGKSLKIDINNVTYNSIIKEVSTKYGGNIIYVGNGYIANIMNANGITSEFDNTGEPFAMIFVAGSVMVGHEDDVENIRFTISIENGELKQLDEKFIPDSVKVQSDWNQNDENAIDYVKNRPFYITDPQPVEVVNGKFSSYPMTDNLYANIVEFTSIVNLQAGDKIKIVFNGVEYNDLLVKSVSGTSAYVGNGSIVSVLYNNMGAYAGLEDTGEPFGISVNIGNNEGVLVYSMSDADNEIAIIANKPQYKPIPFEYLGIHVKNGSAAYSVLINDVDDNEASGQYSYAEGSNTRASGYCAHAEGQTTEAIGAFSHAEGSGTEAKGSRSHAEGYGTMTDGKNAHAEGLYSQANGENSHVSGERNIANTKNCFVFGKHNVYEEKGEIYTDTSSTRVNRISEKEEYYMSDSYTFDNNTGQYTLVDPILVKGSEIVESGKYILNKFMSDMGQLDSIHDTNEYTASGRYAYVRQAVHYSEKEGQYVHIVGNGENGSQRSNAHTLDWDGNAWFSGDVYVGSTSGTNRDEGSKKLITAEEVPQSDWNQNDENSVGFIANKPFYKESVEEKCYEGELAFNTYISPSIPLYAGMLHDPETYEPYCSIVEGDTLVVSFDDVEYTLQVKKDEDLGVCAGNLSIMSSLSSESPQKEDTGEPFMISGNGSVILTLSTEASHNISILRKTNNIKTLESEYLSVPVREVNTEGDAHWGKPLVMNDIINNVATGDASIASGTHSVASGDMSFVHGYYSTASGNYSTVFGGSNNAIGDSSYVIGYGNYAFGENSFAEGTGTLAYGDCQHVQGKYSISDADSDGNALNTYVHIVGNGTDKLNRSNAHTLDWEGNAWFAGDVYVGGTSQDDAVKLGEKDWNQSDETASDYVKNRTHYITSTNIVMIDETDLTVTENWGVYSKDWEHDFLPDNGDVLHITFNGNKYDFVVEGSEQYGVWGFGVGDTDEAFSEYGFGFALNNFGGNMSSLSVPTSSVAEFKVVVEHRDYNQLDRNFIKEVPGKNVEGKTFTYNEYNKETGYEEEEISQVAAKGTEIFNDYANNIAIGQYSHAEGYSAKAIGEYSHAEGYSVEALGFCSHAEGQNTVADTYAHAEGMLTKAYGRCSHTEGQETKASGDYSHAEGCETIATGEAQHVQGKYNIEDTSHTYAHIVGNGASDTDRSNAHTLDWSGNAEFQGDVKANACGGEKPISLVELGQILSKDHIVLADKVNGFNYILEMHNGQLVSFCECESVEVVEAPSGIHYDDNGNISELLGMLFIAHCKDGSTREITNYSFVVDADYNVTLTYVENNVEFTATTDLDAVPA